IEEKNFEKILEKISKEYKKQFKGKDLEDRENWLDYLYDDFGKNRGWIKDVEKEIKDGQMKTGLRGKIGLEEQIKKIIEEKIEEKAKEKKLRK
ncbi:hypothetical protein KKA09_03245, partial [Patescibacteria group bacterium]|nr:hypothetical protein [Patescibacteria group bacterium]